MYFSRDIIQITKITYARINMHTSAWYVRFNRTLIIKKHMFIGFSFLQQYRKPNYIYSYEHKMKLLFLWNKQDGVFPKNFCFHTLSFQRFKVSMFCFKVVHIFVVILLGLKKITHARITMHTSAWYVKFSRTYAIN